MKLYYSNRCCSGWKLSIAIVDWSELKLWSMPIFKAPPTCCRLVTNQGINDSDCESHLLIWVPDVSQTRYYWEQFLHLCMCYSNVWWFAASLSFEILPGVHSFHVDSHVYTAVLAAESRPYFPSLCDVLPQKIDFCWVSLVFNSR